MPEAFAALQSAIQVGVQRGLWKEADVEYNPAATDAEIESLRDDTGLNLRNVGELLKLSNGFSFNVCVRGQWVCLNWGGTGPTADEKSIRYAFGYSGQEGKAYFRSHAKSPYT